MDAVKMAILNTSRAIQYLKMLLVILSLTCQCQSANIPLPGLRSNRISNSLSPNGGEHSYFQFKDWIKISEEPPKIVNEPIGSRVELECEAIGSPSPSIQWLHGNTQITENESYESNMINENINRGLSKIKSRLVINNLLPVHQGTVTCVATSGSKTTMSTSTLFVQGKFGSGHKNFSDYIMPNLVSALGSGQTRVRIVLWNTIVVEVIGSDLILPCKVIGSPKPDIFWINNNNEQIMPGQDPRLKVLPDGELRIQDLSWSDMGPYTCVARNEFSKDSVTTFVYPTLGEN